VNTSRAERWRLWRDDSAQDAHTGRGYDVTETDLNQQAALRHLDGDAAAVTQPHVQPWEARLAVDGEEVEVVVVPGEDLLGFVVLAQVRA
jgi:hypothetical protein